MHNTIVKLLEKYRFPKKGKLKILDAGCGTGGLLVKLAKYGNVYGIDISSEGIKLAKKRDLKNLQVGTVTALPYKNNFFDVVVCIDVLYHQKVTDDAKALAEFSRVLKPNGILILKVPSYNWLRGKHDSIAQTKHRFTKPEVELKLKNENFKVKKNTYANMFIFPIALLQRFVSNLISSTPKSDLGNLPSLVNNLFIFLGKIEDWLMEKVDLPFGLTIFSVASKTNKGNNKKKR